MPNCPYRPDLTARRKSAFPHVRGRFRILCDFDSSIPRLLLKAKVSATLGLIAHRDPELHLPRFPDHPAQLATLLHERCRIIRRQGM